MKTYKPLPNTQRLISISNNIIPNDLIFKIKEFSQTINMEYLEKKYFKDSNKGQPAIPIWIPFAVWVYSYMCGQLSYRKVGKLCITDDNYYWLSNGFEPSGSFFEKWRIRIFPLLPAFVEKFLIFLKNNNMINNKILGLDGVKVRVWASVSQSKTEEQILKEAERLEKKIKEEKNKEKVMKYHNRRLKLLTRQIELIKRKNNCNDKEKQDEMRINITSPNTAVMATKNEKWIQGKNLQLVVNEKQIINTFKITNNSNDNGLLKEMYYKTALFWGIESLPVPLLADNGYWNILDIEKLFSNKENQIIMPSPKEATKWYKKVTMAEKKKEKMSLFKYDELNDRYICVTRGIYLERKADHITNKNYIQKVYSSKVKDCKNCIILTTCQTNKRGIKILTSILEDKRPGIKEAIDIYNNNKELYKKRKIMNEPVHGQMYHNMNVRKLHCINDDSIDGEIALLILIFILRKYDRNNLLTSILASFKIILTLLKIHPQLAFFPTN